MDRLQQLSPDQILHHVRVVFADADVVSSTIFPGRHANLNYGLELVNPTMSAVLKVYLPSVAGHAPRKETQLLRLLTSETGVPVPRVLHFEESLHSKDPADAQSPVAWALHTRLPGQSLHQMWDTLADWELGTIGYEMGRYLGHIHQIPLEDFGEIFVPDPQNAPSEREYVIARVNQWLAACARHQLLSVRTLHTLGQVFADTELLERRQACLTHGDYRVENIIVERGATGHHVTGILELEHAKGGSPELDMSKLFIQHYRSSPTLQKDFLDGYAEAGELGAHFWERLRLYQSFSHLEAILQAHDREQGGLEEEHRQRLSQLADQL